MVKIAMAANGVDHSLYIAMNLKSNKRGITEVISFYLNK